MSVAGGLEKAFERAAQVDSDAVQIFTSNQRQWKGREVTAEMVELFKEAQTSSGIQPVVTHNSYLINMASPKDDLWEKSIAAQELELERCESLGIPYVVAHPGAHTGSGREAGIERIVQALDRIHADLPGYQVITLLETTAGQGTTLGAEFEDLAEIINSVAQPERLGVCFDTCHIFVAGYDCRDPESYAETIGRFDEIVGLDALKAFHFNDSKGELGSNRDRHDYIGQGEIGVEGFRNYMNDARLAGLPALLETDKSEDLHEDREAIELLRSLVAAESA
jgi:deoxyribonuclease-4